MNITKEMTVAMGKLIKEIGPILKTMDVPTSQTQSYRAVSDREVKTKVGQALAENGFAIFPTKVDATEQVVVAKNKYGDEKSNVFVSVKTEYVLSHISGGFITLQGYGHGVDSQDKAAGKATTYALKYLLLYLSLAPTGNEEDFTETRPDDAPPVTVVPPPKQTPPVTKTTPQQSITNFEAQKAAPPKAEQVTTAPVVKSGKHQLKVGDEKWPRVLAWIVANKGLGLEGLLNGLRANNEFGDDVITEINKQL